ncbi:PulJ/GspJ family protein [Paraglaciecola sp.]|uniref:PulJ/GspJ family protein n=1 Tax=Paraglaciecola sp. TaxID=1920173 RepID=UPI003EF75D14
MSRQLKKQGFTLVELVTVIIVLGVVSVGIFGFIRSGMGIYADVNERDQLLSDSRFIIERLSRELRQAIPNSTRTASSGDNQCLEFVPALWATYYTSLSVYPDNTNQATLTEIGQNTAGYQVTQQNGSVSGDYAFVYPTSNTDIYANSSNKRREILSCSEQDASADDDCWTLDDSQHTATLTFTEAFGDNSPASRLYFGRQSVSYCTNINGEIRRYQNNISETQIVHSNGGVLMADGLTNTLPFQVVGASLTRNGLINILFAFERNEETINYNIEVHIPNVP